MNNNANRGPEIIYLKSSIHSQTSQPYLLEIYINIKLLLSQYKGKNPSFHINGKRDSRQSF